MKAIKALVLLALAGTAFNLVSAQFSYRRSANTTYSSDGSTGIQSGKATYTTPGRQ